LIKNSSQNLSLGFMPVYIKDVLKKIENQFSDFLTLDDLSAESHISKYHLSREFKRYMGVSIYKYLILTRFNHAKELLKYSGESVEQIAYSCGFHQVSQFIDLFRKYEKKTPLQYRKEWN